MYTIPTNHLGCRGYGGRCKCSRSGGRGGRGEQRGLQRAWRATEIGIGDAMTVSFTDYARL